MKHTRAIILIWVSIDWAHEIFKATKSQDRAIGCILNRLIAIKHHKCLNLRKSRTVIPTDTVPKRKVRSCTKLYRANRLFGTKTEGRKLFNKPIRYAIKLFNLKYLSAINHYRNSKEKQKVKGSQQNHSVYEKTWPSTGCIIIIYLKWASLDCRCETTQKAAMKISCYFTQFK